MCAIIETCVQSIEFSLELKIGNIEANI